MRENEPMHGWFGESWDAPINQIQCHVSTPVDEECFLCNEPVTTDDQGYVMPYHDELEGWARIAVHKRCQHRALGIEAASSGGGSEVPELQQGKGGTP